MVDSTQKVKVPAKAVILFHEKVRDAIDKKFGGLKEFTHPNYYQSGCERHYTDLRGKAIFRFNGVGPAAAGATAVEELARIGVKEILVLGTAGSLNSKELGLGDLVLCTGAVCGEGASTAYPHRRDGFSYPDEELTKRIKRGCEAEGMYLIQGTTWTTETPYRTTPYDAEVLRSVDVSVMEMEASAVFAVANYRKVKPAAVFWTSDIVGEPNAWYDTSRTGSENLAKVAYVFAMQK